MHSMHTISFSSCLPDISYPTNGIGFTYSFSIYIKGDVCISVFFSFVRLYHPSGQTCIWISLNSARLYVLTQLKTWAKNLENGHHDNKKSNKNTLSRKNLGVTILQLGMYMQLDLGSNMGLVLPGHTSSSGYVRLQMPKMVFLK